LILLISFKQVNRLYQFSLWSVSVIFQNISNRLFILSISGITAFSLAGCGGGGLAESTTRSATASVSNGEVNTSIASSASGSISSPRVGLVAYATGVDQTKGQIVALAGIADGATVGAPVTSGTVTYDTRYNYHVADNVSRSSSFIRGDRATRRFDGRTTLTANFGTGRLTGSSSDLEVDGRINGQALTGTAVVDYDVGGSLGQPRLTGSVTTDLNGQIGSNGVIATLHGTDANTAIAGGLVGTSN
jgi:hypothetical protein